MRTSGLITNVLSACYLTWTFVTGSLVHIRQKVKIALEIAAKSLVWKVYNFAAIYNFEIALHRNYFEFARNFINTAISWRFQSKKTKIIPSHPDMYRIMIFAPFAGKNKIHWDTMATNEKELTKDKKSIVRLCAHQNDIFSMLYKNCRIRRFKSPRQSQWNRTVNCTRNCPCEQALRHP
jgi:hypothetical protein